MDYWENIQNNKHRNFIINKFRIIAVLATLQNDNQIGLYNGPIYKRTKTGSQQKIYAN